MNRVEEFKNGTFLKRLKEIQNTIEEIEKKKIPNAEELKMFNRFKKVIKFLKIQQRF